MHWTALMAKRYFPAHARVADDLACIGCGYNLRTLMANANCPECGMEVGRSLFVLAKPQVVADGLRSAGKTYLAMAIMLLPMIGPSGQWPMMVAMAVVSMAAAWRLIGVGQIFLRGALIRLPVIGPRIRLWLVAAVVDLVASLTGLVAIVVVSKNAAFWNPAGFATLSWLLFFWLFITLMAPIVTAWVGHAMALVLGYNWMIIEFRIFQAVAVIGLLAAMAFTLVSIAGVKTLAMIITMWALVAVMGGSLLVTFIALQHLGNAAEQTSETWEDLIDSDRVEVLSQPPAHTRPREPAPVQLSPDRPRPKPVPQPRGSITQP